MRDLIGRTLGHYRVVEKIGEGGMGVVYRAEDTSLKRHVAIKVLSPELAGSQERLERFRREAETLAALDHPNIVHIYSVEEADGLPFLTMQLVEGKRLSELIPKAGMQLERIIEIAIPLAEALAAAHRACEAASTGKAITSNPTSHGTPYRGGTNRRHPALYVPRAVRRQEPRSALGHLLPRCDPLRNGDRRSAL